MEEVTTYNLIKKADNKTSIEIIYNRYASKLLDYAITSWKIDEDDAWEIIYNTIYKTIKSLNKYTFETEKKFSSFIFTIFCNSLRNYLKSKKNQTKRFELLQVNDLIIDNNSNKDENVVFGNIKKKLYENAIKDFWEQPEKESKIQALLKESLEELEDWERILLLQRSINTEYKEIAQITGKSANQLKVYYSRSRKKLINILNKKMNS